jgi:dihydrofolate reductase
MKQQPGQDMHAVGSATLPGHLMPERLIDELWLVMHPIVCGRSKALFKDIQERHALQLLGTQRCESGLVRLHSRTSPALCRPLVQGRKACRTPQP